MAIAGTGLHIKNIRVRFLTYIFLGIVAFGSLMYWKSQLLLTAEYVDMYPAQDTQGGNSNLMKSQNYQLEEVEVSPSAE